MAILFLAAVGGWTATVPLATNVVIPAGASDPAIAANAQAFLNDYVKAEAGTGAYLQAEHWLTGQALTSVQAEGAPKAAADPGLTIVGGVIDATMYGGKAIGPWPK